MIVSSVIIRFLLEAHTSAWRSKATKSHRDAAPIRDLTFWLTGLIWTVNTCSTVSKSISRTQLPSLEADHTFLLCLFNCVFQLRGSYAVGSAYPEIFPQMERLMMNRKCVKGIDCYQFWSTIPAFRWRDWRNMRMCSLIVADIVTETRNQGVPNTARECCTRKHDFGRRLHCVL